MNDHQIKLNEMHKANAEFVSELEKLFQKHKIVGCISSIEMSNGIVIEHEYNLSIVKKIGMLELMNKSATFRHNLILQQQLMDQNQTVKSPLHSV